MEKIELQAEKRQVVGGSLNSLRREGFLPSVVYGHNFESLSIQVKYTDFEKVFKKAGESTLISLKIGDKEEPVVIKDIQKDPISDQIIHADFYKVNLKEKVKAKVPVVFIGESEAVKGGGVLVKTANEFEVEALPQDLPHELSVDISALADFGDELKVKDIKISDKVILHANLEDVVALVQKPREEKVEEAAVPSVEEVEVIKPRREEVGVPTEASEKEITGASEEKK